MFENSIFNLSTVCCDARLCVVYLFYAVMMSVCLVVYFLIIALFIFLLSSLAQLLQTKQIFPKHSGQEVADSIDLRI